jgi:hypothetical protein
VSLDRSGPGDAEHPDRLDRSGGQLRRAAGVPGQHSASGGFGIERVALAVLAAQSRVRAWHLEHGHVVLM